MLVETLFSNSGRNSLFSETLEDKPLKSRQQGRRKFVPIMMNVMMSLSITELCSSSLSYSALKTI